MEEHFIDIRDLDTEYFEGVRVWLDRGLDRYYLPQESAARLGEASEDGNYALLDGSVIAEAAEIEVGGQTVLAWGVPTNQLVTRPSRRQQWT